jgi:hypothetical protein
MKSAREMHVKSRYAAQVKMCSVFDGNAINNPTVRGEMAELLSGDIWQTVENGRPLMYYFNDGDGTRSDIAYYKSLTEKLGLPAPFSVIMSFSPIDLTGTGADAVSAYCTGGSDGEPYAKLAEREAAIWRCIAEVDGNTLIPFVTTGWHNGPRIDHPTTWLPDMKPNNWVEYATPDEITRHLQDALSFTANTAAAVKSILIYAWNEHDEGGWICPTVTADDSRLQAVKAARTRGCWDTGTRSL